MKHLTLVALIFSMLVAVAISGCVVRDHYITVLVGITGDNVFDHRYALKRARIVYLESLRCALGRSFLSRHARWTEVDYGPA